MTKIFFLDNLNSPFLDKPKIKMQSFRNSIKSIGDIAITIVLSHALYNCNMNNRENMMKDSESNNKIEIHLGQIESAENAISTINEECDKALKLEPIEIDISFSQQLERTSPDSIPTANYLATKLFLSTKLNCRNLSVLSIYHIPMSPKAYKWISNIDLKNLYRLSIANSHITNEGVSHLFKTPFQSLRTLSLDIMTLRNLE